MITYITYIHLEAAQFVRENKATFALLNEDVPSWHQRQILDDTVENPLCFVATIPVRLYVKVWANRSPQKGRWFQCVEERWRDSRLCFWQILSKN